MCFKLPAVFLTLKRAERWDANFLSIIYLYKWELEPATWHTSLFACRTVLWGIWVRQPKTNSREYDHFIKEMYIFPWGEETRHLNTAPIWDPIRMTWSLHQLFPQHTQHPSRIFMRQYAISCPDPSLRPSGLREFIIFGGGITPYPVSTFYRNFP